MLSINTGHSTVRSSCWAIFPFITTSLFVLHTASSVSSQFCTLSTRKKLHNSQIYLLQSMLSVSRQFCMLSIQKTLHNNQIYLLQSIPYAEHTENSVLYPDFCYRQVYLLQSMSSVIRRFRMLSIRKTLYNNQIYLLQSMSYAEHIYGNSVPYSDFLLCSFLHFESFLTIDQPILVDNYCDSTILFKFVFFSVI